MIQKRGASANDIPIGPFKIPGIPWIGYGCVAAAEFQKRVDLSSLMPGHPLDVSNILCIHSY
jgi:hypothetical protein